MNGQYAEMTVRRLNSMLLDIPLFMLRPEPKPEKADKGTTTAPEDETSAKTLDAIVCRRCGHEITAQNERVIRDGAHAHTFANPEGIVFDIGCFREAWGCGVVGPSSSEFTWFPGTEWQIAVCTHCLAHLGWRFLSADSSDFHGLILDRLASKD